MKTVLLFGGTGNLGRHIVPNLKKQGYFIKAVVRDSPKADAIRQQVDELIFADVTKPGMLGNHIFEGVQIIVSALGKSVSLNDHSKPSFRDIDYQANKSILDRARNFPIEKFVYVSAFQAEQYPHLEYFKTHADFSRALAQSGIPYTVIKPAAIMSAFADLVPMARKGRLMSMGTGEHRTNPIFEGDLAAICVDAIKSTQTVVEAGGKHIYTRMAILEIINQSVGQKKPVRVVPIGLLKAVFPFMKLFKPNMFDKMSFYLAVNEEDLLAPQLGDLSLEAYFSTMPA